MRSPWDQYRLPRAEAWLERENVAFSLDARFLTASFHRPFRLRNPQAVWESATGGLLCEIEEGTLGTISIDGRMIAGKDRSKLSVRDMLAATPVCSANDPLCSSLGFAPDGLTLASGQEDGTVLLWAVDPILWRRVQRKRLSVEEMEDDWRELAAPEPHAGQTGVWALVAAGEQAVRFIRQKLAGAERLDRSQIPQLVSKLADNRFAVRDRAFQKLKGYGVLAEPELRRALDSKPAPETAERIRALLHALTRITSEVLQRLRAIQALELIGSGEARRVLEDIAADPATSSEVCAAKRSLQRLTQKHPTQP